MVAMELSLMLKVVEKVRGGQEGKQGGVCRTCLCSLKESLKIDGPREKRVTRVRDAGERSSRSFQPLELMEETSSSSLDSLDFS